jgi:hypothetical protein
MTRYRWYGKGRKRKDRVSIAKAFIAKAVYNFETVNMKFSNSTQEGTKDA